MFGLALARRAVTAAVAAAATTCPLGTTTAQVNS